MALRTYGQLALSDDEWMLSALEPHVKIKLKAVFTHIPSQSRAITDPSLGVQAAHNDASKLQGLVERYLKRDAA